MTKQRVLDANQVFVGTEPRKFTNPITRLELINALNWYSNNKNFADSQKYAGEFLRKKYKLTNVGDQLGEMTPTFGFICRIVTNGGFLSAKDQAWFDSRVNLIQDAKKPASKIETTPKENAVSIQDRINQKVNDIAGEIEGSIDDYILGGYKQVPSPLAIMKEKVKGVHANRLIDIFRKKRIEYDEVLNTKDEQLKEGYSNFSKSQLKKIIAYCDLIITDAKSLSQEAVKSRKPRKRKVKSPDQLIAKVKYCVEYKELNLKSVDPRDIIGATQLWVFNTKYRKLGCYFAEDASGFTIKGTSILNYNEAKSVQKKIRKPEEMIPQVVTGGKVFLRNVIQNVRAVQSPLNGRLNEETILLKVIK